MLLKTWWLYVTLVFFVSATPGPNMLHVMSQSIHHGPRRALASMAGLMTAILIGLIASALGVGALLKASPLLFDVLRYVGVAYLIWLGIKAWRAPVGSEVQDATRAPRPHHALFVTGLLTGLSNPKFIVFATALLPQFIDPARPFATQLAILVGTFVVIEGFWNGVYALGGAGLARWLEPAGRQRLFNRATGLIFLGFGGALLASRT